LVSTKERYFKKLSYPPSKNVNKLGKEKREVTGLRESSLGKKKRRV